MRMGILLALAVTGLTCTAASAAFDPDAFWSMDEIRKIPFDVEVVSSTTQDGLQVDEMYFTSEVHPDGPTRMFCVFARPIKPETPMPVYFDIHGGGGHAELKRAIWLARKCRCAVVAFDWSGEYIKGPERYTIWRGPNPNPYGNLYNVTPDAKSCAIYRTIMAVRRMMDYVGTQEGIDGSRIACGGGSWGGFLSNLLAGVDDRVVCTFCVLGAGGFTRTSFSGIGVGFLNLPPAQRKLWLQAFDPASYASRVKAATFQYAASNDYYFWLGDVLRNYRLLKGDNRLLIHPNDNHMTGGADTPVALGEWVRHGLLGIRGFPKMVDGSFRCRGNVYTWRAEGPDPFTKSELFFSPGKPGWTARYWACIPAVKVGDTWRAELPSYLAGYSGEVLAIVFDKDCAVSTDLMHRRGTDPDATPGALWNGTEIWDKTYGPEAWRVPGVSALGMTFHTAIEAGPDGALRIGPPKDGKEFAALTNSVVLASGHAAAHRGIRLVLNGNGQPGTLNVRLQRDSGSTKEIDYTAKVKYKSGRTVLDLRWADFKGSSGLPYPFDGLRLDGMRKDDSPITIESLSFIP